MKRNLTFFRPQQEDQTMMSAVLKIDFSDMSFSFSMGDTKMTNDYRVVINEDELYSIFEVYYDKDGNIEDWDESVVCAIGSDLEDLTAEIKKMEDALSRPVLCFNDDGMLVPYVEPTEE